MRVRWESLLGRALGGAPLRPLHLPLLPAGDDDDEEGGAVEEEAGGGSAVAAAAAAPRPRVAGVFAVRRRRAHGHAHATNPRTAHLSVAFAAAAREKKVEAFDEERPLPWDWKEYVDYCGNKGQGGKKAAAKLEKVTAAIDAVIERAEEDGLVDKLQRYTQLRERIEAAVAKGDGSIAGITIVVT